MSDKKTIWRTIIQTLITILTAIGTTWGTNAAVYLTGGGACAPSFCGSRPDNPDNSDSNFTPPSLSSPYPFIGIFLP